MATIKHARTLALQATSPRIVAVPLPTNVTVDLSNTSQALNNLPSYTRVSGVTALATQSTLANGGGYLTGFGSVSSQNSLAFGGAYLTGFGAVASQSSLAYGGGYLTGFGVLASQATVNLASQITGQLANSNVSGLGALALLGSVALDGAYVTNNLAANRIGAGTIAAGVIYAGDVAASQITSGYIAAARINAGSITVDKLVGGSSTTQAASAVSFGLGIAWGPGTGMAGAVLRSTDAAQFALVADNTAGGHAVACATSATDDTGAAIGAGGGWQGRSGTSVGGWYTTSAFIATGASAGIFRKLTSSGTVMATETTLGNAGFAGEFKYGTTKNAEVCNSTHAGKFLHLSGSIGAYLGGSVYALETTGGPVLLSGAFGCNGNTPQSKYTLNAASTDLASVVALCNQIRTALINNGVCA
jgi:hypothetical protein